MYRVKDYRFESEKDAKEAQSELRAVEYLRTKVNMDQPEAALEIYKQLLSEEIFHTIVGYDFLKGLKNFLLTSPAVLFLLSVIASNTTATPPAAYPSYVNSS